MWQVLTAMLLVIAMTGASSAQDFGPYFYRTGTGWAATRHEIAFVRLGGRYVVKECAQPVVGSAVGQRLCWEAPADDVTRNKNILKIWEGPETHAIDATSMMLLLWVEGGKNVKRIKPGPRPWAKTPMAN